MRKFWKQAAALAAIGFALGALTGLGFLAAHGIGAYYAENGAARTALYLVMSGLLGAVNMGSAMVYDMERWGLLRCTLMHFAVAMATVCAVGFSMGWLSLSDPATPWALAGCVAVYFIIWLIMYLRYKRQIRRINEALKRWKAEQAE